MKKNKQIKKGILIQCQTTPKVSSRWDNGVFNGATLINARFFFDVVERFEDGVAGADSCFLCVSVDSGTSLEVESPVTFSVCSDLRSAVSVIANMKKKKI